MLIATEVEGFSLPTPISISGLMLIIFGLYKYSGILIIFTSKTLKLKIISDCFLPASNFAEAGSIESVKTGNKIFDYFLW